MSFVRTALILPFIFCALHRGFAQDSLVWKRNLDDYGEPQEALKSATLTEDEIKRGIRDLMDDVSNAQSLGKNLEAIRKLQLALFLEKQLKNPCTETFELNFLAARIISAIDLRYGLEFYKKATLIIPQLPSLDSSSKFIMLTSRAGVHAQLLQTDSAIFYFQKAIDAARKDSYTSQISAFNNLGVFYHEIAMYDTAKTYFNRSLKMYNDSEVDHIGLYCAIKDNLAQIDIVNGKYLQALATFRFNDSVYLAREMHNKYTVNKVRLMEMMQKLSLSGVDKQIKELQSFIEQFQRNINADEILKFYRFAGNYYYITGHYDASRTYQEKYIHWSDSLSATLADQMHYLTQSLLVLEEGRFENEMKAQALTIEKSKLQLRSAQRIIYLSVFSALAIVTLLLLYFRKRKQALFARTQLAETELKNKEMEARLIEKELMLKKRDLTNLVLHNTQIHDSNHKLIDRLQEITHQKDHMEKEIRSLLMELQSQDQVADRSLMLQANIESLNEEFYQKLKSQYPDLTKAEAELCGFIRINLSTKDISILKNVGAPSVKLSKNRLRKKLGLTPSEDLYEFVKGI